VGLCILLLTQYLLPINNFLLHSPQIDTLSNHRISSLLAQILSSSMHQSSAEYQKVSLLLLHITKLLFELRINILIVDQGIYIIQHLTARNNLSATITYVHIITSSLYLYGKIWEYIVDLISRRKSFHPFHASTPKRSTSDMHRIINVALLSICLCLNPMSSTSAEFHKAKKIISKHKKRFICDQFQA